MQPRKDSRTSAMAAISSKLRWPPTKRSRVRVSCVNVPRDWPVTTGWSSTCSEPWRPVLVNIAECHSFSLTRSRLLLEKPVVCLLVINCVYWYNINTGAHTSRAFVFPNSKPMHIIIITGHPTHSVGGQTSNGRWRMSSSVECCRRLSSSVTLVYAT